MDERAYAAMMRMTIHPLFLPLLFGLILYGNVSYYALILSSLLIHELGHLLVAWLLGVKVERCVIMPYGGEIELKGGYALSPHKQLLISIGGPVATFCCMLMAPFLDPLLAKPLIKIQMVLLLINLIPVWPLDGEESFFPHFDLLEKGENVRIVSSHFFHTDHVVGHHHFCIAAQNDLSLYSSHLSLDQGDSRMAVSEIPDCF